MMEMSSNSKSIKSSFFWTFGERIIAQLVSTIVTIILARLLTPSDYGLIAIVTVFIILCNVFINSGMSSSLVQKKTIDGLDYDTAFLISVSMSLLMYAFLYFSAPLIADFYNKKELILIIRIMSLCFPIAAFNTIQQAYVQRSMNFKRFFVATSIGSLVSGVLGIIVAITNAGVWALVIQYMSNIIINTFTLFFIVRWVPRIRFSLKRAKDIFSFGWKVLLTEIIFTLSSDIKSLVIGKTFTFEDLAYFEQGSKYPAFITNNVTAAINKVMLPAYSRSQNDLLKLKEMLKKCNILGVYLLAPILMGFAATSDNFIGVILTDKWSDCKIYIQIFCLQYFTRPWESSCHQALLAIGRSDVVLKIITMINIVILSFIFITAFLIHNVVVIALGYLASTIVSIICFMICVDKFIGYRISEQIGDVFPSLATSAVMYSIVYYVGECIGVSCFSLLMQIATGIFVYVSLSSIFRLSGFFYIKQLIKEKNY